MDLKFSITITNDSEMMYEQGGSDCLEFIVNSEELKSIMSIAFNNNYHVLIKSLV